MTVSDAREPAWGFDDLALVLGSILPSLLVGALITRSGKALAPALFASRAFEALTYQAIFYLLVLSAVYFVVVIRHGRPFWSSLHWYIRFRGAWVCVAMAPLLMITISVLGQLMRAPIIPNPWESLITDQTSQAAVLAFAAVLGPFWEELMFRGFLFPLLERVSGTWGAILGAAIPFGLIHGAQNQWQWQYMVLVALAGVVFGYARYKTGSTAASTLLHSAYNTGLFVVFLIQRTS